MDLLAPPRAAFAAVFSPRRPRAPGPALHPRGTLHACVLKVDTGGRGRSLPWGARLLDRSGRHRAVVRVSRSAGLPRPLLARRWWYILPYRTGTGPVVLLGGRPRAGGYEPLTAAPFGRWRAMR